MNELNMMHSVKYPTAMDVARKFICKNDYRMMLKFVRHQEDGSIIATDSHRLLKVKNIHGFDKDLLINPNSLDFATGKYPEIENSLQGDFKTVFELGTENIKVWLQMHRSMNQLAKASKVNNIVTLKMDKKGFFFELDGTDITFKLPCYQYEYKGYDSISYCCEYVRDSLEAHQRLGSQNVQFKISGSLKPFIIDNQDDVITLILPVRKG